MPTDLRRRRPGAFALVGVLGLTALLLGGPAAGPAFGSTVPRWSITPTPNSNSFDGLNGVSCPNSVDCWAVGTANPTAALIEHWDGSSWTLVPAAAPVSLSALESVDCIASSDCWAVGRTSTSGSDTVALTEHWDGTRWTTVSSPPVPGSDDTGLSSVTCISSVDCWTVGSYFTNVDPPATQTLAEHWDGTRWTIVATPPLPGDQYNFLAATTCDTTDDCWAVGDTANFSQTLAEHWDGTSWSIVATPNTASAGNGLNGISCASASDCWATGQGGAQALAERWNGRRWSIAPTPTPSDGSSFGDGNSSVAGSSVVCVTAKKCWAVGYAGNGPHVLVEQWNGTSWMVVRAAKPTGSTFSELVGVACVRRGTCFAIGFYDIGGSQETLAEIH